MNDNPYDEKSKLIANISAILLPFSIGIISLIANNKVLVGLGKYLSGIILINGIIFLISILLSFKVLSEGNNKGTHYTYCYWFFLVANIIMIVCYFLVFISVTQ